MLDLLAAIASDVWTGELAAPFAERRHVAVGPGIGRADALEQD